MGYYLLDNRNKYGNHFYSTRRSPVRIIVLHITAGLEDLDMQGIDHSAEATARYAATTSRKVSWHSGADSDSVIDLLPSNYTAWHVQGYNSSSLGLEISKRTVDWSNVPASWVQATLQNSAKKCRQWTREYDIPLRLLSKHAVDQGLKGFAKHQTLDPTRRSDPGVNFPIDLLFDYIRGDVMPTIDSIAIHKESSKYKIKNFQRVLNRLMNKFSIKFTGPASNQQYQTIGEDGDWGPRTDTAWKAVAEALPRINYSKFEVSVHDWIEMRLQTHV